MTSRQELLTLIDRFNAKMLSLCPGDSPAYMTFDGEGRMDGVVFSRSHWSPVSAAEFFRHYLSR